MEIIIAALAIIGGAIYIMSQDAAPIDTGLSHRDAARDAIQKGIVTPLGLPFNTIDILLAQAILETGDFKSNAFALTNSLFNRHKGSGRGEWTGRTAYISAGDADLRIFTDIYQSARDMRQLLQDGLYLPALEALRAGSASGYYEALRTAGFAADLGYAQNLKRTYQELA